MKCARHRAGAHAPASTPPAGAPRRPDAGAWRARLALLPALALLLGALSLFAAAPAEAQGDPTPPSVPRNVVATAGDKAVTLTWEPPSSWGDGHSRRYLLEVKLSSSSIWRLAGLDGDDAYQPHTVTRYTFSGFQETTTFIIENDTSYDFRIVAFTLKPGTDGSNSNDFLLSSNVERSATPRAATSAPGAVTGLTATPGDGRVNLSWTPPSEDVSGYDIHYTSSATVANDASGSDANDASTAWKSRVNASAAYPPRSQAILFGVDNGTAYRIRVRAVNSAGNAPWAFVSATPQATATPTAQWERSSVTVTETDKDRLLRLRIVLSEALTGAATLTISQTDASATGAAGSADWSKVTDDCAVGASEDTSMACAIVIKGDNLLESTETLKLSMSAGSGSIAVGARSTITVTIEDDDAPPPPPTGLTVASRGTGLALSWMHPHRLPRRYEVHYTSSSTVAGDAAVQTGATPSAANGWVDAGHTGISSSRSLTGLTNDVEYRVRVRSVDEDGESAWVLGKGTPALQPVRDLVFEPLNTGLKVSWTAPVDGTPTGFDVHYTSSTTVADGAAVQTVSAAAGWLAVDRTGVTTASHEIGSLVNGRRYRVRVRAVYSAGSSAWVTGAGAPKLTVVSFVRNAATTPPEFTNTLKFPRTEGQHSTIPLTLKMEPPLLAHSSMNLRAGVASTAEKDEDYSGLPGTSVSLDAGVATASFSLTLLNDDIAEAYESLFVELQAVNNAPYTLGADRQAEVVITDDDVVTVSFRKTSYRVSEGDRLPVEVVIDKEATYPITVTAEANADTDTDTADATPGADYRLENPTVTIPAGSRSAPVPPAVTAVVDGAAEDDEILVMTLDNPSHAAGGRVEVGPDPAKVTIADDRPSVSLSAAPNPVAEGSAVTVTATLTAALHSDAAIPVVLTRGTAEAGDYGALTSITVPAGQTSGTGEISTVADADSDDETLTVALDSVKLPASVTLGSPNRVGIGIAEATAGTAPGAPTALNVTPGNAKLHLFWTAPSSTVTGYDVHYTSAPSSGQNSVTNDAAASGTNAAAAWVDASHSGTGASHEIASLTNSTAYRVRVRAVNGTGNSAWAFGTGTPTATPVTVSFSSSAGTAQEGAAYWFSVNLSSAQTEDITVGWTYSGVPTAATGDSCEPGADYVAPPVSETIAAGETTTGLIEIGACSDREIEGEEVITVALVPGPGYALGSPSTLEVEIEDATRAVELSVSPNPVNEGVSVTVTATRSSVYRAATIPVKLTAGTAESGDYGTLTSIPIALGQTTGTATITTASDRDAEDETFTVALDADNMPQAHAAGSPASVEVTITDLGTVAAPTNLAVTAGRGQLSLSWTAPSGTLTGYDVHYTSAPKTGAGSVADDTHAQGGASPSAADGWVDSGHTGTGASHTVTGLVNGTAYRVRVRAVTAGEDGAWAHGTGTPTAPAVQFGQAAVTSSEGTDAAVNVTIGSAQAGGTTVGLTWSSGTATAASGNACEAGADYVARPASVTVPAGQTAVAVTVTTCRDRVVEADETFTVTLATGTDYTVGAVSTVTVTITDDTAAVSLSASPNPVAEGTSVTVTATRSGPQAAVNIPVTLTRGTAESGDFGSLTSIPIAEDATSGTATITTNQDPDAADETFTVALDTDNLPQSHAPGATTSVEITIDDDELPAVTLSASPNPVLEGSSVTVTVKLSDPLSGALTVPLTVTAGTAESSDYSAPASVALAAGSTSATAAITTNQDADEADETFTVALGTLPSSVTAGSPNSVQIVINDDEGLPAVSLSASPNPVAEGSSVTVTATLDEALTEAVTIPLTLGGGGGDTAESGDYGALASISIAPGATTGTGTIQANQDADSDHERFTVALGSLPVLVRAGSPSSVAVRIVDDEAPVVTLSASPRRVAEGSSVTVTAALSSALTSPLTVPLTVTPGTAETSDYSAPSSIVIAAGSTSGAGTITTNHDAGEDHETFTVALGTLPSSVSAGSPSSIVIVIRDDEGRPRVSLSASPNPVAEGSSVTVTATLDEALDAAVTIPLTLDGGAANTEEAAESGDYGALESIRIAAGATTGRGRIRANHDADGHHERFTVSLGALPPDVKAGSPSSVAVRILDDDGSTVTLSAARTRVPEGESVEFTLRFSRPVPMPSSFLEADIVVRTAGIDTEDGDVSEGLQYVRVPGGATSATFTVDTRRDTDGDDERFTVSLPAGEQLPWMTWLTVGSPSSVEIVIDDEPVLVTLSAESTEVTEGSSAEMKLDFSAPVPYQRWEEVRIPVRVTGTDTEPGDVQEGLRNLRVGGGQRSAVFFLSTSPDADRDDERFTVSLDTDNLPAGLAAGSPSSVEMVILEYLPQASVQDVAASESARSMVFRVTLNRPPPRRVAVYYELQDVTATHGVDYQLTDSTRTLGASGTLVFEAGVTERRVTVSVINDSVDEGDETFRFVLSSPDVGFRRGQATGTIRNADPLQGMWLSRFGRAVGGQVTDAVSERLAGLSPGAHATLAGQRLDLSRTDDARALAEAVTGLARRFGAGEAPDERDGPLGRHGRDGAWDAPATISASSPRGATGREVLLGSSFHMAGRGGDPGPGLAFWGRAAHGSFDGEAASDGGRVRLDGGVLTGVLGADAEWRRVLAGLAVSLSDGEGTFDDPGVDKGTVESTLTAVSPYARFMLTERLSVWGVAGWGSGSMTITQDAREAAGERPARPEQETKADIGLRMGALGARGALLTQDRAGGMDLAVRADAFFVRTDSEKAPGSAATEADASRVRLALEGGRRFALSGTATLRPVLELGVRHDGGDAETGTGVELGGGVSWADAALGLSVEARARVLLAHADSDYRDWGASATARLDPGERGRGLSFSVSPAVGAASSAVERLWGARDALSLTPGGGEFEPGRGLKAEAGYGVGLFGGRFTGTPNAAVGLSDGGARDYRIGWRLAPAVPGGPGFELSLDATRREPAGGNAPEHGVMLRSVIRW